MSKTNNTSQIKRKTISHSNRLTAYGFLLPNFIGFATLTLFPIVVAFGLCFVKWDFANPMVFYGFKNFVKLFNDETFLISLWNTVFYTVVSVPLTIAIAIFLAILLHRKLKGIGFFRTIFFFPYISSMVAVAVVWNMLYHPTMGPINSFLIRLGLHNPPQWTSSTDWALLSVIFMAVWKQVGYYMVIYLAGLNNIPEQLYESAIIDGANGWQKFRYITLPMLTPVTFFCTMLLIISSFKVFDQIVMMTQGGPGRATNVLVFFVYQNAFQYSKFGYASAAAMVLFVIVLGLTILQFQLEKKWVHYNLQ